MWRTDRQVQKDRQKYVGTGQIQGTRLALDTARGREEKEELRKAS